MKQDFTVSKPFINRELSWLAFNQRVLEEAADITNPLLERLKFLAIFTTNLDEFFMIRVSGLKRQLMSGIKELSADGLTAQEQIRTIRERLLPLINEQYELFQNLVDELKQWNVELIHNYDVLSAEEQSYVNDYFDREIYPILSPIGLDNARPFPNLVNRTLALFVTLTEKNSINSIDEKNSVIQIPSVFPRFLKVESKSRYVFIGEVIKANVGKLYPGLQVTGAYMFRITRNADLELEEDEADDLLVHIEESLKKRRLGLIVRLEIEKDMPESILLLLKTLLELNDYEMYSISGPLNLGDLMYIYETVDNRFLKYEPFIPRIKSHLAKEDNIFKAIKKQDIFLHHPFYSFTPIEDFIAEAAEDPSVLAIKITLYRTGGESSIIHSLIKAAENGKQVTAVVELKARFDEENNIVWAKALERAGVQVVYGIAGVKIHCKLALVVKRDKNEVMSYLHLSTGNYNPITAQQYTDFGLFTCNKNFTNDALNLFNFLTGYSKYRDYTKFIISPFSMRKKLISLIENEITSHQLYGNGRIIIKVNALVDKKVILKLYEASSKGVKVDLLVRGICSLVPAVAGVSDNINVYSIVGRFLEHSRAFYFYNNGNSILYIGSADIMERNFDRRVEIMFPIESSKNLIEIHKILKTYLKDTAKCRVMNSTGIYSKIYSLEKENFNAQQFFLDVVKKKNKSDLRRLIKKKMKVKKPKFTKTNHKNRFKLKTANGNN
ncbi:MAG: polyphosphate kinase 1 [Ignavibacteria bacterium]